MKLTQQHLLAQQQSQHPLQQQQQQQQQQAQCFPDNSEGQMQQPLPQLPGQLSHMNGGHLAYPVQGPGRDAVPITATAAAAVPAGPSQMTPSSTQQLLAQQQQQQQLIAQRGLLQHLQQQQLQKQQLQQQLPVDIMKPPQLMQHQQHVRQRRLQLQQLQQQQQQLQQQQLQLLRTPESPGLYSAFCRLLQQLSLHRMSLRDARVRVLLVVLRWLQQQQQQQTEPSRLFREDQFERLVKQTRAYMRLLLLQQPLKEDELLQLGLSPALGFKPNREFIAAVAASAEAGTNYKPPAPKEQHQQRPRSHQLFVQLYEQQLQQQQQRALEALEQQAHKYEEVARLRLEKEEQQQHQEEQQRQLQEQRQQPGTSKDNALHTCLGVGGSSEEQRHQLLLEKHMRKQQQVDTKESKREDDAALHSSGSSCCAAEAVGAAQVASSTALTEEESDADGFLSSSDEWWGVGGLVCPVDDGNSSSMQERARISRLQRRLLILAPFQKQIREEVVAQRITESPAQLPPLQHLPVRLARKHRALRLLRERGDRMTAARQQQQQQRQQVLQQLLDSHRRTFLQQQRDVLRQLRRVAAAVKRKKTAAADGGEGAASCGHPLHPTDCGCPGAAAVAAQMRKERLDALRKHDEAGYLKLLQETKNERLLQLVRQTEGYMQQIGSLVVEQREREGINVPSTEEEADGAAEEASGSLSSSFLFSKERYYRITHSQREKVTELPSCLKGGTLRPYQMEGLNWLVSLHNNGLNGILADCMGLGKTVQTVSFLAYLYEKKGVRNPHLILAPLSTLHGNWRLEFKKWWPSLRIVVYEGAKDVRKALRSRIVSGVRVEGSGQETQRFLEPLFDVLLTTDAFVLRDKSFLKKIQLKNPNSKLVQTLNSGFSIRRRIALTGTPLQNDIVEVWALLNFLMPSIFNAKLNFEQWLNVPLGAAPLGGPAGAGGDDQPHAITVTEEEKLLIIDRLHKVLRPFLLRREKAEVANELPSKQEEIVWCPLSGIQRILYRIIEESPMGHNRMVQLRKVCNHPFLFCFSSFTPDESLVRCCGKFAMLDVLLPALKAAQHRVLVFSQMTKLLDLLEAYLSLRGYRYLRLDGGTSSEERQTRLALYNQENSPYFLFILSTKAGGLGVNLQSADTVIIFDSDWNPQNDEQAQSRAHRIGQKREVLTIRFVTPSSVEEQILHSAELKLDKDALVIKSGMYNGELQDRETERQEQVREILRRRKQLEANLTRPFDFAILKNQLSRNPAESRVFDALQKIRQLLHIPGLIYGEAVPPCLFRWSKTVERSQTDLVENTAQAAQDWKVGYALSDFWTTQRKKKQPPAAIMNLQLVGGSVSPLLSQPIASAALAPLPPAASAPAAPPAATADPAQQEGCTSLTLQQSQLQLQADPQSHMQVQQQCQQQQERQQEQLKQVLHAPVAPSAFLTAPADGSVTPAVDDVPAAAASASGTQGESITGNLETPLLAVATGTVQAAGPSLGGTSEPATVAGGAEVGVTSSDSKQRSFGAGHADQSSVCSAAPGGDEVTPEASVLAGGTTAEPSEVTEAGLGSIEAACTTAAVAEGVASNPETSDGAAAASTAAVLDRLSSCGTSPLTGSAAPSVVTNSNAKHPSASAATAAAKAESTVAADSVVAGNAGGRDSSSVAGGPCVRGIPGGSSGCVDLWGCGEGQEGDSAGAAAACLADPQRWRALLNGAISQALTEAIQESRFSAFVELPSPTVYKDYYERVAKPVCLLQIRRFADKHEFTSLNKVEKYLTRLTENARAYNGQESPIFLRALECMGFVLIRSRVNSCVAFHSMQSPAQGERVRRLFEVYRSCWDSTASTSLPDGEASGAGGDGLGGELMEAEGEGDDDEASAVSSQLSSTVRSVGSNSRSATSTLLPFWKGRNTSSSYDSFEPSLHAAPAPAAAVAPGTGSWLQQQEGAVAFGGPASRRKTVVRLPARPVSVAGQPAATAGTTGSTSSGRGSGGSKKQPYTPSYLGYIPQGIELPLSGSKRGSGSYLEQEQQQLPLPTKRQRRSGARETEVTASLAYAHSPSAPSLGHSTQGPSLQMGTVGFQVPEAASALGESAQTPQQLQQQSQMQQLPLEGVVPGFSGATVGTLSQQPFAAAPAVALTGNAAALEGTSERTRRDRKGKSSKSKKKAREESVQHTLQPYEQQQKHMLHQQLPVQPLPDYSEHMQSFSSANMGEEETQRPQGLKPLRIRLSFGASQQQQHQQQAMSTATTQQHHVPLQHTQPLFGAVREPEHQQQQPTPELHQQAVHGQPIHSTLQPSPLDQQQQQPAAAAAPPKFRIRLPMQPSS